MLEKIGRYRIVKKLGEGGMGVVYAAHDDDLDRSIAIKLIKQDAQQDEQAGKRFRREAKAAASVNHPNVCQLFEIGEDAGALFLAMELLEGEPLSERMRRGAVPLAEAVPIMLGILSALGALHTREVVHRDLKPSNVFLTPHGVKLLDFGLARPIKPLDGDVEQTQSQVTQAGFIVGTPRYMAPEQLQGQSIDHRVDLFAVGAILFEMLTGKHPFRGNGIVEVLYAIAHEQPPALTGSPAIEAVDRVVRRALAKRPAERYDSAAKVAQDLREALALEDSGGSAQVRTMTRLIVLPFRILRQDADTDFLAFSLPDAITGALSGLGSLVVRSSAAAARFGADAPDLAKIASEADVDAVLTGTLLRAGEQVRVSTQLVEAPAGTLLWSHTAQVTLSDVFQVQDDLVKRIVDSLSVPLTARESKRLNRHLPASARAYELYLRANQLSLQPEGWDLARDMYERALEEDEEFAPAWAKLGRVYRLIAKYGLADAPAATAEDAERHLAKASGAFRRALEIDPDLPLTHHLHAMLEVEAGRPREVLVRLLGRAPTWSHDAELYAALVHVTRYCGLLEASLAADRRARELDPGVRTSVHYTYWALGEYDKAIDAEKDQIGFMNLYCPVERERVPELVRRLDEMTVRMPGPARTFTRAFRASLVGDRDTCVAECRAMANTGFRDPEGFYFTARALAHVGAPDEALSVFERVVDGGFFCFPVFVRDPWLDPLRADPRFRELLRRAEQKHREAEVAFIQAGGPKLLG
jgi:TolB-like protein